jgi:hypothetical protein
MERTNAAAVLLRGTARNFLERMFTIIAIECHCADQCAVISCMIADLGLYSLFQLGWNAQVR